MTIRTIIIYLIIHCIISYTIFCVTQIANGALLYNRATGLCLAAQEGRSGAYVVMAICTANTLSTWTLVVLGWVAGCSLYPRHVEERERDCVHKDRLWKFVTIAVISARFLPQGRGELERMIKEKISALRDGE